MTSKKRVVVIGGGMAGARLALQLGSAADLTVIGEEPHPAYNRVLLAEVLAGRYAPEVATLPRGAGARWLRGVRAVRVDRLARSVLCDDGSTLPYDALVLATGSNPVLPPLRGLFSGDPESAGRSCGPGCAELPDGVCAFRTMDDCLTLAGAAAPGTRAVVVGGGLLGVSAARALVARGARVVLAHQGGHLLDHQLDPGAATLLRGHLETGGVEIHTGCRVRGLRTRPATGPDTPAAHRTGRDARPRTAAPRAVEAVELADGYRLDCEVVVLACGVRPRAGLARAAGLEVARGIVVDDRLRTGDPRIHAIGDCAEHAGVLYGLAGAAQEQADVLARVLAEDTATAGEPPRYTGTRALTRLTLAAASATAGGVPAGTAAGTTAAPAVPPQGPLDLAAFGETVPGADDEVVHLTDATRSVYRKVIVRGDRLVGGVLLGDLGTVGALARTWEDDGPVPDSPAHPLLHLLTHEGGH